MPKRLPKTNTSNSGKPTSRKKYKYMSQPIRVEDPEMTYFCTSRCVRSELWFVNAPKLEERILAFLGMYQKKYGAVIYAFQLVGNHYHMVAKFPNMNASSFFRDFNSKVANSIKILVPNFPGGALFERRPAMQPLPTIEDIEYYFLYTALQPVSAGLTQKISDYPGYNFSHDAIRGVNRFFKLFRYGMYQDARSRDHFVSKRHFWFKYQVVYSRLPGYEDLKPKEYHQVMIRRIEERRVKILNKLKKPGFLTKKELRKVIPGSTPYSTKRGGRIPLVLSHCPRAIKEYLKWYFEKVTEYKFCSKKYRKGDYSIEFPVGTYRPSLCVFPEGAPP